MKTSYFLILFLVMFSFSCKDEQLNYVCTPCDLACDELSFSKPGNCPQCSMELIKKEALISTKEPAVNEIDLQTGSGYFLIEGGNGKVEKTIKVFYHKPENFSPDSKLLLVIPGAGRNGDSYRDAWTAASEKYSLLILSPMYPENDYPFGDYHLGGLIQGSNLSNNVSYIEGTNIAKLNEENFTFTINSNSTEWIFNDFDRIFDLVSAALNSNQTNYDIFGHSAGGHILHRMALFHKGSKVKKIFAANPSFYTLASFEYNFPFGLKESPIKQESLKMAFKNNLVVFLGELDNENETGGTFLRSESADKQGLHRLARGKFFFKEAEAMAKNLGFEFNWQLIIVPEVGHDHRLMGRAAAEVLYNNK